MSNTIDTNPFDHAEQDPVDAAHRAVFGAGAPELPPPVPPHPELVRMAEAQAAERKAQARERRELVERQEKFQADLIERFNDELSTALDAARTEARLHIATARYTERLKSAAPGLSPEAVRAYAAAEAIKDADALLEALKK